MKSFVFFMFFSGFWIILNEVVATCPYTFNKYIRQGCTFSQVPLGPTAPAGSMDETTCGEPGNIEVPQNESYQLFFSLKNAYDFIMVQFCRLHGLNWLWYSSYDLVLHLLENSKPVNLLFTVFYELP